MKCASRNIFGPALDNRPHAEQMLQGGVLTLTEKLANVARQARVVCKI